MKNRIKQIRKYFDYTQQEFADRLKIKGNAISQYESGRNKPIDAVVSLICREFNVNEEWLRTGDGEMFGQEGDDPIGRLCAELCTSALETDMLRAYFRIDPRLRDAFAAAFLQELRAGGGGDSSGAQANATG